MEGKGILFKVFCRHRRVRPRGGLPRIPKDVIRFCQLLEPNRRRIISRTSARPTASTSSSACAKPLGIPSSTTTSTARRLFPVPRCSTPSSSSRKTLAKVKIVFAGAGAAAIATAEHYVRLGVRRENIVMCDHKGVILQRPRRVGRLQQRFAIETKARTLADALQVPTCFVGLSVAGIVNGRHAAGDGEEAGDLRARQSDARDHAGRAEKGASRRNRGDGPVRISRIK